MYYNMGKQEFKQCIREIFKGNIGANISIYSSKDRYKGMKFMR